MVWAQCLQVGVSQSILTHRDTSQNVRPSFHRQQTETWKLNSLCKATSSGNKLSELHRGKPGERDLSEGQRRGGPGSFYPLLSARAEHANSG